MSFSLHLRRNKTLFIFLFFLLSGLAFESLASFFLDSSRPRLVRYLQETFGYSISLDKIKVSFIKGIHIEGARVYYPKEAKPAIAAKGISMYVLPLFINNAALVKVVVDEYALCSKNEFEGNNVQVILSDIHKKLQSPSFAPSPQLNIKKLFVTLRKCTLLAQDTSANSSFPELEFKDVRIDVLNLAKVKCRANLAFSYPFPKSSLSTQLLKESRIDQNFLCFLEGETRGNDFFLDTLFLRFGTKEIFATGVIRNFFERRPQLNVVFTGAPLAINDFLFLKDNIRVDGSFSVMLRCNGPLENVKFVLELKPERCSVEYTGASGSVVALTGISGKLVLKDNTLDLENFSLKLNTLPLACKGKAVFTDTCSFSATVTLPKHFVVAQKFPIENIQAIVDGVVGKELSGNLFIEAMSKAGEGPLKLHLILKDIRISPKDSFARSPLTVQSLDFESIGAAAVQKLHFSDCKGMINFSKSGCSLSDLVFRGYGGMGRATFTLNPKNKNILVGNVFASKMDAKEITQDLRITKKLLSGSLDAKIRFSFPDKEFMRGVSFINDGMIDLGELSNAVKLPPLQATYFKQLHLYCAVSNTLVKIRGVKLTSPDITLNAFWDFEKNIHGILNMKVSKDLLSLSPQFKKLISITGTQAPYIDFKFLLGGTPKAMRALWAKGVFKQRLEQSLPSWIKRRIEVNLDDMINELAN